MVLCRPGGCHDALMLSCMTSGALLHVAWLSDVLTTVACLSNALKGLHTTPSQHGLAVHCLVLLDTVVSTLSDDMRESSLIDQRSWIYLVL